MRDGEQASKQTWHKKSTVHQLASQNSSLFFATQLRCQLHRSLDTTAKRGKTVLVEAETLLFVTSDLSHVVLHLSVQATEVAVVLLPFNSATWCKDSTLAFPALPKVSVTCEVLKASESWLSSTSNILRKAFGLFAVVCIDLYRRLSFSSK